MNYSPQLLADYQREFHKVHSSLVATCHDLIRDLNESDRHLEALAVDEAQLYLRAALKSIERTLATLNGKAHL
jgi:thymidine kinase